MLPGSLVSVSLVDALAACSDAVMHSHTHMSALHCQFAGDESPQHIRNLLLRPDVRHHLSKLLYAAEWAKSIEESHLVSEARSVTLAKHWEDVDKIREALHNVQNKLLPIMQSRRLYDSVMAGTKTAWF